MKPPALTPTSAARSASTSASEIVRFYAKYASISLRWYASAAAGAKASIAFWAIWAGIEPDGWGWSVAHTEKVRLGSADAGRSQLFVYSTNFSCFAGSPPSLSGRSRNDFHSTSMRSSNRVRSCSTRTAPT